MTYPSYLLQYLLQEKEESQDSKPTLLVREGRKAPALGRATRALLNLCGNSRGANSIPHIEEMKNLAQSSVSTLRRNEKLRIPAELTTEDSTN